MLPRDCVGGWPIVDPGKADNAAIHVCFRRGTSTNGLAILGCTRPYYKHRALTRVRTVPDVDQCRWRSYQGVKPTLGAESKRASVRKALSNSLNCAHLLVQHFSTHFPPLFFNFTQPRAGGREPLPWPPHTLQRISPQQAARSRPLPRRLLRYCRHRRVIMSILPIPREKAIPPATGCLLSALYLPFYSYACGYTRR